MGLFHQSIILLSELENRLSGFNSKEFIESFKEYGGIWIELESKDYHTYDGSHLKGKSARKLSSKISEILNQSTFN